MGRKLGWFALLYLSGLIAISALAWVIRLWIG